MTSDECGGMENKMKFNLEYYRAFFAVGTFSSFTKAAENLYLTQPAVSSSVKKLEMELGCQLFSRTPSGLKLTKEGEILYTYVKKAFKELQMGEHQLMKLADFKVGELKIGSTETALRFLLAPQIEKFKNCYPHIHITFMGSTTRETCKMLQNGNIEVAFLIEPIPAEFRFNLINVGYIQDVFVVNSNYPIDFDRVYSLSDIVTHPLISIAPENCVRAYYDDWFLENGAIFMPEFVVQGTGLVLPMVYNNLGIGIIPLNYVDDKIKTGELAQLKVNSELPPRAIYLATNQSMSLSITGQQFIRFVTESEYKI